jgi:hypothetical protein
MISISSNRLCLKVLLIATVFAVTGQFTVFAGGFGPHMGNGKTYTKTVVDIIDENALLSFFQTEAQCTNKLFADTNFLAQLALGQSVHRIQGEKTHTNGDVVVDPNSYKLNIEFNDQNATTISLECIGKK